MEELDRNGNSSREPLVEPQREPSARVEGGGAQEGVAAHQGGGAATMSAEMSAVMQMFLEDRRKRELELAEERRKWEAELMRRDEHNRQQIEALQSLVKGVHLQTEAANKKAEGEKDVRVPKLTLEDDIVAYLTMFERLMSAYEVKRERWAFKLAANLVGKAQQAYAALSAEDASSYDKLKEAILQRYDITEESYRQRFRTTKKKSGESSRELVARLDDLALKWLKSCKNLAEVRDRVVMEQFLNMQPEDIKVFILERKPATTEEAGRLADDFLLARKEGKPEGDRRGMDPKRNDKTGKRCLKCGFQATMQESAFVQNQSGLVRHLDRRRI